jgi:large subunit ribosomal protein L21
MATQKNPIICFTRRTRLYRMPQQNRKNQRSFQVYAIIEQGAKQYKIAEGDVINIELMDVPEDAKSIDLDKVLFVSDGREVKIGRPYLKEAKVVARFAGGTDNAVVKGPKLYPMHFRRRKNSRRRIGHRQKYLQVVIEKIEA